MKTKIETIKNAITMNEKLNQENSFNRYDQIVRYYESNFDRLKKSEDNQNYLDNLFYEVSGTDLGPIIYQLLEEAGVQN